MEFILSALGDIFPDANGDISSTEGSEELINSCKYEIAASNIESLMGLQVKRSTLPVVEEYVRRACKNALPLGVAVVKAVPVNYHEIAVFVSVEYHGTGYLIVSITPQGVTFHDPNTNA